MSRPFSFPDPEDRPKSRESTVCLKKRVLGLYDQEHGTDRKRMSPDVESWFETKARSIGWRDCRFSDEGCTLTAEIKVVGGPQDDSKSKGSNVRSLFQDAKTG